jgi:acyl-CoA reductase-like NAD-dependent aldehyde dehydrogenase
MRGTFQNVGQNCVGLERILVHEKIYDAFLDRVKPLVENLRVGPPLSGETDCGAITMGKQVS